MIEAERALHQRASWACAAAQAAGVPGRFRAWEQDGALAVLATDPALSFLSSVTGATPETAFALLSDPIWRGVDPVLVLPETASPPAGLVRTGTRPLAVAQLTAAMAPDLDVVETDEDFVELLLAGYEVSGVVASFIRAEHQLPQVRRFVLMDRGTPIAAASMTAHGHVAVLGGASTLRAHRGKGAQSRLLRHRLHVAAETGCTLAVATAAPGSVSAANLHRAGFVLHQRTAWVTGA